MQKLEEIREEVSMGDMYRKRSNLIIMIMIMADLGPFIIMVSAAIVALCYCLGV